MRATSPLARRRLGRSGLEVSCLGFGTAPLGDFFDQLDEAQCLATLRAAQSAGITLFDTAPHYGNGLAEHRLGSALRGRARDDLVLCTKIGRVMTAKGRYGDPPPPKARGFAGSLPHRMRFDYSYDGVMRSLEQSLLRLGCDRIDILLVHDIDPWTHGAAGAEACFGQLMASGLHALEQLRAEGVVRAIGLGLDDHIWCERLLRAGDFDLFLLAGRYSLLEQPALARLLPLAQARDIGVMLGGVFNSGILATGARAGARYNYDIAPPEIMAQVARIEAVCARHQVRIAHAAVQFALAHPAVASVVLGGVHPDEVARNLAALALPLPSDLWAELKAEGLLDPAAPTP